MIPTGTGIFKIVYDKEKYNRRVKEVNSGNFGNKNFEDGMVLERRLSLI